MLDHFVTSSAILGSFVFSPTNNFRRQASSLVVGFERIQVAYHLLTSSALLCVLCFSQTNDFSQKGF